MTNGSALRMVLGATLAGVLALPSCKIGDARELDTRRDLSGLELHYLREKAEGDSEENTRSIEGELAGWPFWFAPAVTLRYAGSKTLHLGDVQMPASGEGEEATAAISGFEHRSGSALGLGTVLYQNRSGAWRPDGSLDRWTSGWGVGWGLVYSSETSGGSNGLSDRRRASFLCGLLGYTGDEQQSTFHVLWLPIPIW